MPPPETTAGQPDRIAVEFATTDPDRAQSYLTSAYDATMTINGDRRTYQFRHVRLGGGAFHLDTLEHRAATEYRCGPVAAVVVGRVHRGMRTDLDLDEQFGPGDLGLHAHTDRPYHVRQESVLESVVSLPPGAVSDAARNHPDGPPPALSFTAMRPIHPADTRRWVHVVDYVTNTLLDAPAFITHPLLVGPFTRLLAATLLTTFPNSCMPEPRHHDRTDATEATLARAIAYVDANADLDISSVDIARAARVTVRAVQLAFRRHLGTTPLGYLRSVRLDRAHQQLRDALPGDGTTVAGVAARWGYADARRFTTSYRRAYGRAPNHTLRR
ncbi:helix-turn-helix protein [Krasilnikovia cinnamomea]|uniref:Helix-turn-helix protein n=1 Tax=Krasilnikovia cinnamomea TaxID=349313 RepID=A0A4Q7ZTN9_9ACTN|nr:helix-turn-helix transcriptional regulator [Krasilnikovia cinnamomea]RZU53963.1 helix-turn-helix protein [Krasilnikovia cinnamomea]